MQHAVLQMNMTMFQVCIFSGTNHVIDMLQLCILYNYFNCTASQIVAQIKLTRKFI